MNKKVLGVLLVAGAAGVAVVVTRKLWVPLVKAGVQDAFVWALDEFGEDVGEDRLKDEALAAFEADEKGQTQEPTGPIGWGGTMNKGEINYG